jgi:hypothetical protein
VREAAVHHLARALVRTAAFLELAGDEEVDPHVAARALEEIGLLLDDCTPEEKQALLDEAAAERAAAERDRAGPEVTAFYARFGEAFGLKHEP